MNCDGKNHSFKIIYSRTFSSYDEFAIVRWCKDCGAVVVDIDMDGRTFPGAIRGIEFPNVSNLLKTLTKEEINKL